MVWELAEGWIVNQIPSTLPPLFSGDRLVVYGLLKPLEKASQGGKNEVRLQGTFGNNENMEHLIMFSAPTITTTSHMSDPENNLNGFLHRLAAKTFIEVKQDGISSMRAIKDEKSSIISISKSANVVSKFTSFVAVDKDNHEPVSGPLQKCPAPLFQPLSPGYLAMPLSSLHSASGSLFSQSSVLNNRVKKQKSAGWFSSLTSSHFGSAPPPPHAPAVGYEGGPSINPPGPFGRKSAGAVVYGGGPPCPPPNTLKNSAPLFIGAPPPPPPVVCGGRAPCPPPGTLKSAPPPPPSAAPASFGARYDVSDLFTPPAPVVASQQKRKAPAVLSVISLQKASGAWDLTDQLVALCGTSREALITGCPTELAVDTTEGKLLWATALALVLLMGKFLDQKDEWEMIAEKGKKWMKKNLPATVKCDDVLKAAAAAVGVQI